MFHPTLMQIVFGGKEQKIKSLDLNNEETKPEEIETTNNEISNILFNSDGSKI
jgi:hypothetical protein